MRISPAVAVASSWMALVPALAGQPLTAELKTATPYGNFARDAGTQDFASLPAGTSIPSAGTSVAANTGNAFADSLVGWRVRSGVASVDASEQGGGSGMLAVGTTPSPSAGNVVQAAHALRFLVRGAPGLRGKLEVWASGLVRSGSNATLQADVGDDGSIDFAWVATEAGSFRKSQWDVALGANGELAVRMISDARATLPGGDTIYKVGLSVVFTPGAFCDMVSYGPSCGPGLSGSDSEDGQTRQLTLQVGDAPVSSPGVLVFGTNRLNLMIPGTNCFLLTDIVVSLPAGTDASGLVRKVLSVPFGPQLQANVQAIVLGGGGLTSTNGVAIACR